MVVIKILLSFLFLFLVLSITHASNECPTATCDKDGPIIKFPFWLLQQQQQNCKPSGFNLSCNGSSKYPILHIPDSGDFYLTSVYYSIRVVTLQDVEGCLPTRLMSLDLSSSPFLAMMYKNYTFFSCTKGQVDTTKVMKCASNTESDVYATTGVAAGPYGCSKIATVPVPVSSYHHNYVFFPDDLELTWNAREPFRTRQLCINLHITNCVLAHYDRWLRVHEERTKPTPHNHQLDPNLRGWWHNKPRAR